MSKDIIISLALSLFLTLALETGFFLLSGRLLSGKVFASKPVKKDFLLVILVNILTNPAVVILYWLTVLYTDFNIIIILIALELFAILAEGYYYKKYGSCFIRPYLFSALVNIFSFWTGLFLQL